MYLIVLDEFNRIKAARDYNLGDDVPEGRIIVENLPDGEMTDFLYQNNEYIYDPLPRPDPNPVAELTLEERIADLEIALCELMEGNQ